MWKKSYSNSEDEEEIANSAKSMMADLEMKAYNKDTVPAWMSLIQSKTASAYYLDPKGTREQTTAIQELGFIWVADEIIPPDAERIFQTHQE